jgi:hypothetical protein
LVYAEFILSWGGYFATEGAESTEENHREKYLKELKIKLYVLLAVCRIGEREFES